MRDLTVVEQLLQETDNRAAGRLVMGYLEGYIKHRENDKIIDLLTELTTVNLPPRVYAAALRCTWRMHTQIPSWATLYRHTLAKYPEYKSQLTGLNLDD